MRCARKENRLTQTQIRELDQIGFTWRIRFLAQASWEQRFKELKAFKKEQGHCNVPRSYPLNQPLAYWVDRQRRLKRKGELDRKTIRRLNEVGFSWSLLHRRFHRRDMDEFVALVAAFKKRHGHCDLLAAREGVGLDFRWWVMDVRKSRKQGRLDIRYFRQLDKLGFLWEPRKRSRQDFYSALLNYRKRYGDCRVPVKWPENPSLASWVSRMRAAKKRNLLTEGQIRDLDEIGFVWSGSPQHLWEQRVKELEAFKRKHGHCNVPKNYSLNLALARWVSRVRRRTKLGKLAKERIRRLAALGFTWEMSSGKRRTSETRGRNPTQKPKKPGTNLRKHRS
jgi:hypothetical protein